MRSPQTTKPTKTPEDSTFVTFVQFVVPTSVVPA